MPPTRCICRCTRRTSGPRCSSNYLNDPKLTDKAWFRHEDIFEAWRKADMVDGRTYGIPYDGEMTVQIYRKDLYDAKGLKPAETLDDLVSNAKALHDPANRMWGFCLRGMPGAGQNMYIYPSILGAYGGKWFDPDGRITGQQPRSGGGARVVRQLPITLSRRRRRRTGTGRTSPTPSPKARSAASSTATPLPP